MLQRKITKNCFRKKKINYCYGFIPGDFQAICGSVVGETCLLPTSTETPAGAQRVYTLLQTMFEFMFVKLT